MRQDHYVSVTAGVTIDEINAVIEEFTNAGYTPDSGHAPAIGFLVSEKTLHGGSTPNLRFPAFNNLPALMRAVGKRATPVIHYNSRNLDTLSEQVKQALDAVYEADLCRMVQLNTRWPDTSHVKRIKEQFQQLKIILQVSCRADQTPAKEAADRIALYGDGLDHILIDPSRGRGEDLDVAYSTALYSEIRSRMPQYSTVFAGGLNGENVEDVLTRVINEIHTTEFSIDAEGKLRDTVGNDFFGQDTLNINKVRAYLQSAAKILK